MEKLALGWLAEDLRRRAEAHTRKSFQWASSFGSEEAQEQIDGLYRGHVRFLLNDPDLKELKLRETLAVQLA